MLPSSSLFFLNLITKSPSLPSHAVHRDTSDTGGQGVGVESCTHADGKSTEAAAAALTSAEVDAAQSVHQGTAGSTCHQQDVDRWSWRLCSSQPHTGNNRLLVKGKTKTRPEVNPTQVHEWRTHLGRAAEKRQNSARLWGRLGIRGLSGMFFALRGVSVTHVYAFIKLRTCAFFSL